MQEVNEMKKIKSERRQVREIENGAADVIC
jgi:hypothetical protein